MGSACEIRSCRDGLQISGIFNCQDAGAATPPGTEGPGIRIQVAETPDASATRSHLAGCPILAIFNSQVVGIAATGLETATLGIAIQATGAGAEFGIRFSLEIRST